MRTAGIDTNGTIFIKSFQFLAFADDIDTVARNLTTVKETFTRPKAEAIKQWTGNEYDEDDLPCLTSQAVEGDELDEFVDLLQLTLEYGEAVPYGFEAWTMLQEDDGALVVFERMVAKLKAPTIGQDRRVMAEDQRHSALAYQHG